MDNLDKICVALDISMSDFFSAQSKPAQNGYITEDEQQLLWISRNLSKKNQEHLITYAKGLQQAQNDNE